MIIGVSGPMGAGKTTLCEILKKKGFGYVSLSDILREEVRKRGLKEERDILRRIGNELREKYGKAALAVLAWEKIKDGGNWVIDSIRVPEEAKFLQEKGAKIVQIVANEKIRFERIIQRKRDKYRTFEEFLEGDKKDRALGTDDILKIADFVLINEGSMEDLEKDVNKLLKVISSSP